MLFWLRQTSMAQTLWWWHDVATVSATHFISRGEWFVYLISFVEGVLTIAFVWFELCDVFQNCIPPVCITANWLRMWMLCCIRFQVWRWSSSRIQLGFRCSRCTEWWIPSHHVPCSERHRVHSHGSSRNRRSNQVCNKLNATDYDSIRHVFVGICAIRRLCYCNIWRLLFDVRFRWMHIILSMSQEIPIVIDNEGGTPR